MNSTGLTGLALVVLGVAGVFSTAAVTAAIPAIFGLIFLLLALWGRNPARARSAGAWAAGVAALGILAGLGNVAGRLAGGNFVMNAAAFASISMALICALYLAFWLYERARKMA
jgi:hypothetical protein